jgi:hypothetical protein
MKKNLIEHKKINKDLEEKENINYWQEKVKLIFY